MRRYKRRKTRKVLCSYPIPPDASEEVFKCFELLSKELFGYNETYSSGGDPERTRKRQKYQVSVDSEDLKSLQPGHMLKGAVINLFIKHLDYGNNQEKDSNIETYSTDFYPMLCKEGIEKVMTWQGIDPFNRKIINLPICFGNHWRLVVLLNPGSVLDSSPTGPMCCILGFDSLTGDDRLIGSKAPLIRAWLNAKWNATYPSEKVNPFNEVTMPAHAPSNLKQSTLNVNDCGVHTMLMLRMMYKLRTYDFSKREDAWFTRDFRGRCGYGSEEVTAMRKSTTLFIERLHAFTLERMADAESDNEGVIAVVV